MATSTLPDLELLRRLVAFDSTSQHSNLPLVDFVADYLDRPGVRLERVASADGTKANLLVVVGPERNDTDGLILSGHTDVVPPGGGWSSDPFVLVERRDTLVARGACDMKGFLAVAINHAAAAATVTSRAPLVLLLTYDEEVGTLGARRFAESWPRDRLLPRCAVIGEPTSLRPIRMHKGHLRLRVECHGKSAHSAYPQLGVNAIEHAGRAVVALTELRAVLQRERPPMGEHFPDVPYVALNMGQIRGGTAVNVVPAYAAIDLGVRLLPGQLSEEFIGRVRDAVASALDETPFGLTIVSESPPMAARAEADHYRFLSAEYGRDESGVSFATDAGWLHTLGIECVIWGPGSITVAHQPNEYVPTAEVYHASATVGRLIDRFCRGQGAV